MLLRPMNRRASTPGPRGRPPPLHRKPLHLRRRGPWPEEVEAVELAEAAVEGAQPVARLVLPLVSGMERGRLRRYRHHLRESWSTA